jgi:hypothetical protein
LYCQKLAGQVHRSACPPLNPGCPTPHSRPAVQVAEQRQYDCSSMRAVQVAEAAEIGMKQEYMHFTKCTPTRCIPTMFHNLSFTWLRADYASYNLQRSDIKPSGDGVSTAHRRVMFSCLSLACHNACTAGLPPALLAHPHWPPCMHEPPAHLIMRIKNKMMLMLVVVLL